MEKIEKLFEEKYGIIRGAQSRLAKELKTSQGTVASWISGRNNPSPDMIKKISKIFSKSEEEIKEIFEIKDRSASLKKIDKVIIDIPTLGIIKDKEVLFVPSVNVPKKEDVLLRKEFELEVGDDKLPPYKKKEMIHFLTIDNIKGYEGRRFIVKNNDDTYCIVNLDKPSIKHEVIAVVLGRYIPEE